MMSAQYIIMPFVYIQPGYLNDRKLKACQRTPLKYYYRLFYWFYYF